MSDAATETEEPDELAAEPQGRSVSVVVLWLSEASRERIHSSFRADISEELDDVGQAELVAISTRMPKVRVATVLNQVTAAATGPVAVVCHAGGEDAALSMMQLGAICVVAEGNEARLHDLVPDASAVADAGPGDVEVLSEEPPSLSMLQTFSQRLEQQRGGDTSGRGRDAVTGLLGASAFELRVAELTQRGQLPRLGFLTVANPDESVKGLDKEALDLVRRRVAALFLSVTHRFDAELFTLTDTSYAYLARGMTMKSASEMGQQLVRIASTFAPLGAESMKLAVGHAGPEVASELRTLRDLATRALDAAQTQNGGVVSADDLSRSQAATTELEAALKMATFVDEHDPYEGSHSSRVADYAVEIGRELGYDGHELVRLRLSALLHDIGKTRLPVDDIGKSHPDMSDEQRSAYQEHAASGGQFVELAAGPEVAAAIRGHHEKWDGSGFPDALAGEEIPIAARLISVADAYDSLTSDSTNPKPMSEVITYLEEAAGTAFDPTIVEAALQLFGES